MPEGLTYRTKTELALDLMAQGQEWALPAGTVVADSAYGNDFAFRQTLRDRQLGYAVAVEASTVVWLQDPNVALPPPGPQGRPRRQPRLQDLPAVHSLPAVAQQLPATAWHRVTWRTGTRGPMRSRFALVQTWAAHGWKRQHHPPDRVQEWLLIEWPEERPVPCDYWMLWQPGTKSPPSLRRAIHAAKSRWKIEQDDREFKEELGLDHFEGRGWLGWHHHVTLVSLACAFLRSEQVRAKKNFWCDLADDASPAPSHFDPHDRTMSVVPQSL